MNSCLTSGCWGRKLHHCQVDWNDGTRNTLLALSLTDFCKLYVIAKGWNMNTKHAAIFILWLSIKVLTVSRWNFFATKSSINSSGFEIFFNHPQVWPPPKEFRTFWPGPRLEQLPPHPNLVQWRAENAKKKWETFLNTGVSKNSGTPKWMVYNGKPYSNGWFGGTTIFGNIHMFWVFWACFRKGIEDGNVTVLLLFSLLFSFETIRCGKATKNGKQIIKCGPVVPMSLFNILMYVI